MFNIRLSLFYRNNLDNSHSRDLFAPTARTFHRLTIVSTLKLLLAIEIHFPTQIDVSIINPSLPLSTPSNFQYLSCRPICFP